MTIFKDFEQYLYNHINNYIRKQKIQNLFNDILNDNQLYFISNSYISLHLIDLPSFSLEPYNDIQMCVGNLFYKNFNIHICIDSKLKWNDYIFKIGDNLTKLKESSDYIKIPPKFDALFF